MSTATITADRTIDRGICPPQIAWTALIFAGMLSFVGAVSVYDGYLVIRTGEDIRTFEKNPVGLCLIEANQGDPSLFLFAKGIGTSVVLAILTVLYRRSQRLAFPVASALLAFQTGLLIFLEYASG